jgi:hypothetical protein
VKSISVVVCAVLLLAATASAEIRSIDITVFGMD